MIAVVLAAVACRDRVVAAFVTGAAWQFRDWKWKAANEALSNMAGFYVKFDAEPVPAVIGSWNATVLKVCWFFLVLSHSLPHFVDVADVCRCTDEPHPEVSRCRCTETVLEHGGKVHPPKQAARLLDVKSGVSKLFLVVFWVSLLNKTLSF